MSLLEVIIAVFIMAVVFIPLGTLIFGGVRGSEQSRTMAVAVNLATDAMEQVLNGSVPFGAIVPEGGPAVQGGFKAGLKQASFAPAFSELNQVVGGDERVIVRGGVRYEIFLFAGVYKDRVRDEKDIYKELTFSYFAPPSVETSARTTRQVVLQEMDKRHMPYLCEGNIKVKDANGATITVAPDDGRARPGWPDLEEVKWRPTYRQLRKHWDSEDFSVRYPLKVYDQESFDEKGGTLMKLIVGVRWRHGAVKARPGDADSNRHTQEFWLVSFKGKVRKEKARRGGGTG